MKRYILMVILLTITPLLHATERPTIAILPFGIAKDRSNLRWLSFATASTLTETLRRIPSVRILPFANVVQELQSAGMDPEQAAWAPAVATEPLGQWLKTDRVLLGAIGKISDQKIANIILQAQEPPAPAKGAQIWLAARVVDINNGQTLGKAYVEGNTDNILNLQRELLIQLGGALNINAHLTTLQYTPATDLKTYQNLAKIEQFVLELPTLTTEKQRERTIKKAIKSIERVLRHDPESATAHTYRGTIYGLQNRPKTAMQAFETAIEKDPAFTTPRYGLVDLALQQEDLSQAVAMLETITQIAPYDDEAYHLQGTIYRLLNQPDKALSAYKKALAAYNKRPKTQYETGQLYLAMGQNRKAILAFQQAVEQMPGALAYQISLADAHLSARETTRARVVLDRIASVSKSDPEYQLVRGKFDHQIDQYDNALTHFQNALELLPNRAEIYAAMGQTYGAQKRFTDAIKAFISAQSHGIALPQIALPFGDALEAQGQMAEAEDLYLQTLKQAPKRADLRLRLVKHFLSRNATKEAIEALQEGVSLHPNRGDFHLLLGDLYASQNENVLAINHYQKALELGVSPMDVAAQLGQIYLSQNQPDQAKVYYEQAQHAGAMGAYIYAGLGTAEELLGNQRAALNAFQQALKANPQHPDAQQAVTRLSQALRPKRQAPKAQDYATRAQRAQATGDLMAAQNAYEKALSISPTRSDWWRILGTLYIQQGQTKRAETAFQSAIHHAPNAPEHQYNLGKLYADMGWIYDAEGACREALKIDPNYSPAQQQLGAIYLTQGEYLRAKSTFENLLQKETNNANAQLGLGNAHAALGEWDLAEAAYMAAQEVGAAATIGLGNLQLAQGDTTQAIYYYEHAIDQDPQNPTPHVNLGLIHATNHQFEQALSAYQNALNLSPNDPDVLTNLIALYTSAEQYDDALELCTTVQDILPDAIEPKQLTGAVAYAASKFELALIAYQSALDLNPKDIETLQGIASTYEALDDTKTAQEQWQTWLSLVGDNPNYSEEITHVTEHLKTLVTLNVGTGQGLFP
jgi:tetratricopeptide (TPR) repeat protein